MMKKYKRLTGLFAALAILLSNVMCAAVAYSYCSLQWCGRYGGCSAPADAAFLLCIPYGLGIAICVMLTCFFVKKYQIS
ncbi:MAG: hypothetical protein HFG08_02990 [Oscillibacter sp.]|jgi:hypothetical protein|nr:hypothetical protein [Oscillibacter sp.]